MLFSLYVINDASRGFCTFFYYYYFDELLRRNFIDISFKQNYAILTILCEMKKKKKKRRKKQNRKRSLLIYLNYKNQNKIAQ